MSAAHANVLNDECFCVPVRRVDLFGLLDAELGIDGFARQLRLSHPHLFSETSVFIGQEDLTAMEETVAAIEAVAASPLFQEMVLATAPDIAQPDFGPRGVLMGYDFHISEQGPRLIEVNTNAGGAFLNALLQEARDACCTENAGKRQADGTVSAFAARAVEMFSAEWTAQRGDQPLHHIAIVDRHPEDQYLYPDFLLARTLLERHGFTVTIADPARLTFDGQLSIDGEPVDLVYNRLTDFYLQEPENSAISEAYRASAVVMTPNPHHHALLANKQNLVLLSDPELWQQLALTPEQIAALGRIPACRKVNATDPAALWQQRNQLFFKPLSGHAGKAVYRGDKITRRVFDEVVKADYIAQATVAPSERRIVLEGKVEARKMDVRLYTYAGETLMVAARLYQGQTTNFRTPGGGFAPVLIV